MSYTKTNWENSPSTNTPLNASNLNKMENQLEKSDRFFEAQPYQNNNLNTAIEAGIYAFYNTTLNRPSLQISGFADYGNIIVIRTDTWVQQIAIGNYSTPIIAKRTSTDSGETWGNWQT